MFYYLVENKFAECRALREDTELILSLTKFWCLRLHLLKFSRALFDTSLIIIFFLAMSSVL